MALALAQEACLLQSDRGLVRGDVENELLRPRREVGPWRSGDDAADLTTKPKGRAGNRQIDLSDEDVGAWRPPQWRVAQGQVNRLTDLSGSGCTLRRTSDSYRLDGTPALRIVQAHTHKVQMKRSKQRIEEGAHDVGLLAVRPPGRQRQDGDQIVQAGTQPCDVLGRIVAGRVHLTRPSRR